MLGDFSSSKTVVFTDDCVQFLTGVSASCADSPTLVDTNFDNTNMTPYRTFTDLTVGGYTMNGDVYNLEVCQGTSCRYEDVYAANVIFADDWLFGQQSGAGILGYGPDSANWQQFIEPSSGIAMYSISLARVGFVPTGVEAPVSAQSNITFGGAQNTTYYTNMPSV